MRIRTSFLLILGLGLLLLLPPELFATMINEGGDAVEVEVTRKNGNSYRIKIYPQQSQMLPLDAAEVKLITYSRWGDESIKLKVVDGTGDAAYINKVGGSLRVNTGEKAKRTTTAVVPTATNNSNIVIQLVVTDQNGDTATKTIMPDQSISLPTSAIEVKATTTAHIWGDEVIEVNIRKPDGKKVKITAIGGRVKLIGK